MSEELDDERVFTVEERAVPMRLDAWLAETEPAISRARWQKLIENGDVLLNGKGSKASQRVRGGEVVECTIPPPAPLEVKPENLPLEVLYEDTDVLVLNKAPGMVVHPAPGHFHGGTLVNALLFHCADLGTINGTIRPGIVHRLDKDTSGAMVVAKNDFSMLALADQFKARTVRKEYAALVRGHLTPPAGVIQTLMGRSPSDRQKMSVHTTAGREAITHYETVERFSDFSRIRVVIKTGRTHQIRVHMAHLGHPVAGDAAYGKAPTQIGPIRVTRQMLHAELLSFQHPRTQAPITCRAPLFPDMLEALDYLRAESHTAGH